MKSKLVEFLKISSEVEAALAAAKPVVALESTIISHGMPYPKNVETALAVEAVIREAGAIPATIGLIEGRLVVGMNRAEIERLGRAGLSVTKTSRRDFPLVLARRELGATTVAGTMIAAAMAGIRFFATGGCGGVHRGGELSLDISADLEELAQTSVLVVCAGVKSILDIGRTLEYLETKGVPVYGYQTTEMPAFYTRESGHRVPAAVQSAEEAARAAQAKWALGLTGGILLANPIPEEAAMDATYIQENIEAALAEAEARGIAGKDITPFLLDKIQILTGGSSLEANIQLVLNNARLAAEVAKAYAALEA